MARRAVTASRRLREPVIVMLNRGTRRAVEQLAHAERVSLSEIGRRAVAAYVRAAERATPGEVQP